MATEKSKYLYVACFLSPMEMDCIFSHVKGRRLDHIIENPHVTLSFQPIVSHQDLFGTGIRFDVIGYASDGRNEGVLVEPHDVCEDLQAIVAERATHHITLSLAEGEHAVKTSDLTFEPINPFSIEGVYGACTYGHDVILKPLSPEDCAPLNEPIC